MRNLKIYLETSAWNFYFADDAPEKRDVTKKFFDTVHSAPFSIYASEVVLDEFSKAGADKQKQLLGLIQRHNPIVLEVGEDVTNLAKAYLDLGALPRGAYDDALHVACASAYELDLVISWNLRHIANIHRQEKVQGINLMNGYTKPIQLITPMEVSEGERS